MVMELLLLLLCRNVKGIAMLIVTVILLLALLATRDLTMSLYLVAMTIKQSRGTITTAGLKVTY